ncbi:PREDICTED: mucin-17-like isoform X2 [Papilio polytes]|uniref:mucin-17-like isoform X2 n=1 Tax=Papilio polytes TaxID=76194 RepID=UPI000676505D|nr:PREDICTED: mucin-17-like isoform X2 [Papilio polytes]
MRIDLFSKMNSACLLSIFLFAILQTATSEECTKFDVKIEDKKLILNTSALCSSYGLGGAKPSPPEISGRTCKKNTPLKKTDGIVSISLEDLCGECETEVITDDARANASATEASSSIKPTEKTTTPLVPLSPRIAESELLKDAVANASATEVPSSIKPTEKTTIPLAPLSPSDAESKLLKDDAVANASATEVPSSIKPTEKTTIPLAPLSPSDAESKLLKDDAVANASATEVPSSIKPTEKTTIPLAPLSPSDAESAPHISTSNPALEVSSDKPLDDATVSSSTSDKSIESETKKTASDEKESPKITATASNSTTANTTETKGPLETEPSKSSPDKSSKSAHLSGEQSGTSFSGGAVFLFFLCGAVIGVLAVLAVIYIRKRYHSRSYETNDAPEQP